jgi:hypothetical protein
VTYNFDPDRWWEREYSLLQQRRDLGELDAREFETAVSRLELRLEALTRNLDGSYQVVAGQAGDE